MTCSFDDTIVGAPTEGRADARDEHRGGCHYGIVEGDLSERTWQKSDRTFWQAKKADTFKPMGRRIETDVDLDALV